MPKVSICIPTFEQVEYLRKCLDSVLIQNYSDYEVIITDDSRTDRVKTLISEYDFGGKLKYYKNEVRLGSPENWNEAIRKANGEYIKIVHHDDCFESEDSLVRFVDMLDKNPESDFGFSASLVIIEGQEDRVHSITEDQVLMIKLDPNSLYVGNLIGAPSAVIFRNNLAIFFDKNLKWLVDLDFYIRFLHRNNSITYTEQPLIITYAANERVSDFCEGNKEVEIFEYFFVFQKIIEQNDIITFKKTKQYILFVISICRKYSIRSIKEIRECGYGGKFHYLIRLYLFSCKLVITEKIFIKILRII